MGRGGWFGDGDSVFMGECVGFMLVVVFLGGLGLCCNATERRSATHVNAFQAGQCFWVDRKMME